jgi:hypothetical protein
MRNITVTGASLMLLIACGSKGRSEVDCQKLLDQVSEVAEKSWSVPKAKYKDENKGIVKQCMTWSQARYDCTMAIPDISGESWARCNKL